MSTRHIPVSRGTATILSLCFLTAIIEGFDLQSMGIAAPKLGPAFHLAKSQLGAVLAASPAGLLLGAFAGGRLADLWGRKVSLILSTAVFGAFQLATVLAHDEASLIVIRFLCGLGMGGALPNLIALTSEAAGGRNSLLNVVITAAGMPVGGVFASGVGFLTGTSPEWRTVFFIGGFAPLVLAAVMLFALPESQLFLHSKAAQARTRNPRAVLTTLFGEGRPTPTLLLWMSFFGTALVVYMLLNWLPSLMVANGFTRPEAFLIQLMFNAGGALGAILLGWRMQRRRSRLLLLGCYAGLGAALAVLAGGGRLAFVACDIAAVGALVLGAQFILYGLSPEVYPSETRGTGAGAAVAAGRLGALVGPYLGGQLLQAGASAAHVLQALLPVVGIAGLAAVVLVFSSGPGEPAREPAPLKLSDDGP